MTPDKTGAQQETGMLAYRVGDDVGDLERWPFINEESGYEIVRGNPEAYGRIDGGGPGYIWRSGIWRCTEGAIRCNELGDEMQTILAGRVSVIHGDGSRYDYGPGDTFFTVRGERMTWDVHEDVTKVFFALNPDGF